MGVKTEEEIKAEKAVKIAKKKEAAKGGVTKKKDVKAKEPKIKLIVQKPKRHTIESLIPKIDPVLRDCMKQGYAYACIGSRPGQCGRADGYLLEGKELISTGRRWTKRSRNKNSRSF